MRVPTLAFLGVLSATLLSSALSSASPELPSVPLGPSASALPIVVPQGKALKLTFVKAWGTKGSGNTQFDSPQKLSLAGNGDLLIADAGNHRALEHTVDGAFVKSFSTGLQTRPVHAIGKGTTLWMSEANRVAEIKSASQTVSHAWASPRQVLFEPGTDAIYVVMGASGVVRLEPSNGYTTGTSGYAGFGAPAADYDSVALDPAGNVYTADVGRHMIFKSTKLAQNVTVLANKGTGDQQVLAPTQIVSDSTGLYVIESGSPRIHKFGFNGQNLGTFGSLGAGEGQFQAPRGIAVGGGYLYVSDAGNSRIQKFKID